MPENTIDYIHFTACPLDGTHLLPGFDQVIDQIRTNKPCTSGYQNHLSKLSCEDGKCFEIYPFGGLHISLACLSLRLNFKE